MANQKKGTAMAAVGDFFKVIGGFFSSFGTAVAKGDLFVKLSLLWWGLVMSAGNSILKR